MKLMFLITIFVLSSCASKGVKYKKTLDLNEPYLEAYERLIKNMSHCWKLPIDEKSSKKFAGGFFGSLSQNVGLGIILPAGKQRNHYLYFRNYEPLKEAHIFLKYADKTNLELIFKKIEESTSKFKAKGIIPEQVKKDGYLDLDRWINFKSNDC